MEKSERIRYAETKQHVSTLRDGRNGYARIGGDESIDRLMELTAEYSKSVGQHNFMVLGAIATRKTIITATRPKNWNFPTDRFSWNNIGLGAPSAVAITGLIRTTGTPQPDRLLRPAYLQLCTEIPADGKRTPRGSQPVMGYQKSWALSRPFRQAGALPKNRSCRISTSSTT